MNYYVARFGADYRFDFATFPMIISIFVKFFRQMDGVRDH